MAAPKPKAWFPSDWMAQIRHRKVEDADLTWAFLRPFFDTWREAHQHMLSRSDKRLDKARRELKAAESYAAKVKKLQPPARA